MKQSSGVFALNQLLMFTTILVCHADILHIGTLAQDNAIHALLAWFTTLL
jgi:hypothetical protein